MSKLTREQKIEIYNKRIKGQTIVHLSKEYNINEHNIKYLIRLISMHGIDIVNKEKNNKYSKAFKQAAIQEVLIDGKSTREVALKYKLNCPGLLSNWIRSYKENGYVIVEKTKGRPSTMKKPTSIDYNNMSNEDKIKHLEEKNLYLEAELEYIKKLRAVVQASTKQQQNKK